MQHKMATATVLGPVSCCSDGQICASRAWSLRSGEPCRLHSCCPIKMQTMETVPSNINASAKNENMSLQRKARREKPAEKSPRESPQRKSPQRKARREIEKILQRMARTEICITYVVNMQKICSKYAENMPLHRLQHSKYAKYMHKICKYMH